MNTTITNFARQALIVNLAQLPERQQRTFRLMYARDGGRRSVADAEQMPLDAVVAEIPDEKLDWALTQTEAGLAAARERAARSDETGAQAECDTRNAVQNVEAPHVG